jgi:hypothetical protein
VSGVARCAIHSRELLDFVTDGRGRVLFICRACERAGASWQLLQPPTVQPKGLALSTSKIPRARAAAATTRGEPAEGVPPMRPAARGPRHEAMQGLPRSQRPPAHYWRAFCSGQ